jgi:hypothetical protein
MIQPKPPAAPQQDDETLREVFMKAISGNPQFREAGKSGEAVVIVGNRPSRQADGEQQDERDDDQAD